METITPIEKSKMPPPTCIERSASCGSRSETYSVSFFKRPSVVMEV